MSIAKYAAVAILLGSIATSFCAAPTGWVQMYPGHGGTQTSFEVGIVVGSTSMDACIKVTDFVNEIELSAEAMDGMVASKWDRTNQQWLTTVWDILEGGWYPNLALAPGDVVRIYYNSNNPNVSTGCFSGAHSHGYCRKIWQVGTQYINTNGISITIKPGWNLLAGSMDDPLENTGTDGEFIADFGLGLGAGDKATTGGYELCPGLPSSIGYILTYSPVNTWSTTEYENPPQYLYGTDVVYITWGGGFWLYNNASTNRAWTAKFTGNLN